MTSWPEFAPLALDPPAEAPPARFALWPLPELPGAAPRAAAPEGPPPPTQEELALADAYAAGRADGEAEATARAAREVGAALEALAGAAQALEAVRAAFVSEVEEQVAALAVAVGAQLLQREVAADPTVVRDLVRQAVALLPVEGMLEIRLHPDDLAALAGQLELQAAGGRALEAHWVPDATLERGSYRIETAQRVVDGRVEPVLQALYERLRHG